MSTIPFKPFQGTQEIIEKQDLSVGNLYFATDTGKIFLDTVSERIVAGGSGAAVLYASADEVNRNTANMTYEILLENLEDSKAIPKENDLIINKDGRFFKVIYLNKESSIIVCSLVAVSGGGSSDPSDPTTPAKRVTLTPKSNPAMRDYVYGKEYFVEFVPTDPDGDFITMKYIITSANDATQTKTFTFEKVPSGSTHRFDLGSKLFRGSNTLIVQAVTQNNGMQEKSYQSINSIVLQLLPDQNFNALKYAEDTQLTFSFLPLGELEKTVRLYLNDALIDTQHYLPTSGNRPQSINIPEKSHGVYSVKATLEHNGSFTDPLEYEVAFVDKDNTAPLIWFKSIPKKILNSEELVLQFMVYDPEHANKTTVTRQINGVGLSDLQNISYSDVQWISWPISNFNMGRNTITLGCGNTTRQIEIVVEQDTERDLSIVDTYLVLNLNSKDRSNDENKTSRETWEYQNTKVLFNNFNWKNNGWILDHETNNSVLRISNGASIKIPLDVIKINENSNLKEGISFECTFKLRNVKKYNNLISFKTEKTDQIDPVTNEPIIKVIKNVESTDGVWCNYYDSGARTGLCLGTQEGFFAASSNLVSGRYKEDQIITVSFSIEPVTSSQFPLMYMYIDGVMCSIVNCKTDTFEFFKNDSSKKYLEINSNYCDVDLYNIRVYQTSLACSEIVQNHIADKRSALLYDMNNITVIDSVTKKPTIDYKSMVEYNKNHPDELLYPYAVLERTPGGDDLLPFVKDGEKKVNVTFVNPTLDKLYNDKKISDEQYLCGAPSFYAENVPFDVQGTSSQGYPRRNYKGKFKKATTWTYTNGPLKNKSLKEKNTLNGVTYEHFYMDNTYSESTFTWKADYMESSMTHNTGFASFVNTLYSKHPLNDYDDSIDTTNRRTTIYGFPMMVFQKTAKVDEVTQEPIYEFVGRYNFNLDKGCNNVIGFNDTHVHKFVEGTYEDKGVTKPLDYKHIAECWEVKHNQGGRVSFEKANFNEKNADGLLAVTGDFEVRYHIDEDGIEAATKGESKGDYDFTNASYMTRNDFLTPRYSNLEVLSEWIASTNTRTATGNALNPAVTFNEYDYVAVDDMTEEKFNKHENTYYIETSKNAYTEITEYQATVPNYVQVYGLTENDFIPEKYYVEENSNFVLATKYDKSKIYYELVQKPQVYYTRQLIEYNTDSADYRLAKFRNEFSDHLDLHYSTIYFIMTEFLLQYDSRGKNMMLASWGPQKRGGHYIWYPIFYDIDTQLGVNNSGVPSWEYFTEATLTGTFSTSDSVLWNNFYACFKQNIMNTYDSLRKNNLNYNMIEGYYSYDGRYITYLTSNGQTVNSYAMQGHRPINVVNIDQYYKYIAPTLTGYINTSGKIDNDGGKRFYCLQGDRNLHRKLFLQNRFNFMDSLWRGGTYSPAAIKQQFQIRCNANKYAANDEFNTSDRYLVSISQADLDKGFFASDENSEPIETDWTWKITPYLQQYVSLQYDDILQGTPQKYLGDNNPITIEQNNEIQEKIKKTPNFTQQLFYIGGAEYISSLGDLSLKYPDEIYLTSLKRLKDIRLGNDNAMYQNNALTVCVLGGEALSPDGTPSENAKTLLESVVLTGVSSLDSAIDLTGSEKLKEFRALRTNIPSVDFANSVQINTAHLPQSIRRITLKDPLALTKTIKNYPTPISSDDKGYNIYEPGLYVENVTDLNPENIKPTLINTLNIEKGSLGYDSYSLLKNLVTIKQSSIQTGQYSKNLAVALKEVNWSPYRLVKFGEEPGDFSDGEIHYKKATDHYTLEDYTPDADWSKHTLNQIIYEIDFEKKDQINTISDLDLLKLFINENGEGNLSASTNNYFTDSSGTNKYGNNCSYPYISGLMFVNNVSTMGEDGKPVSHAISEAEIKNKFNAKYPDLQIFVADSALDYTIKLVEIDPVSGQEIVHQTLKYATLNEHDYKHITAEPNRLHSVFGGWKDEEGNIITEDNFKEKIQFSANKNIYVLYAYFTTQKYQASFYDGDTLIDITPEVPHKDPFILTTKIPTRDKDLDGNDLELTERLAFCGWSVEKFDNPIFNSWTEGEKNIVNVDQYAANENKSFYAVYVQESVFDSATDNKYFRFEENVGSTPKTYTIHSNPAYELSGKITLPITYNNCPITTIGNFQKAISASHIFFMKNGSYTKVSSQAFQNILNTTPRLIGVYLPNTITSIDSYAFHNVYTLKYVSQDYIDTGRQCLSASLTTIGEQAFSSDVNTPEGSLCLTELPTNLKVIKANAFFKAGENIKIENLPNSLEEIQQNGFAFCRNLKIANFGTPDSMVGLQKIGDAAFTSGGDNVSEFILYKSIKELGSGAFADYGTIKRTITDGTNLLSLNADDSNYYLPYFKGAFELNPENNITYAKMAEGE